ncbi:MAG TPA: hypothetical protein VMZ31_12630 [Phycisphaerae bacterium]|nr:hypothetical protein [Phycisphaerae bacterium]
MIETLVIFGAGALAFAAGMGSMWLIARSYGRTMEKLMTDAHNRLMSKTWVDYLSITPQEAGQPTAGPLQMRRSDDIEYRIERGQELDGQEPQPE